MEKIDKYRYKDDKGRIRYYVDDQWEEAQNKWLETHDKKYLWEMYPAILLAVKSCMIKRLKGQIIPNFNEKAEEAALYQLKYHIKHPNKRIKRIMGWASYLCMYALYGPPAQKLDRAYYETSYEAYTEGITYDSFEDDIIEKLTEEGY
jgi:hypothetical protein